jgi:formate dehydrogenase maturation protein FdhE
MAIADKDNRVLKALATAREQNEELNELLDFYYDLYEVQYQAKAGLPEPKQREEQAMRWRLEQGMHQVAFGDMGVESELFLPLVSQVSEVCIHHNPSWVRESSDVGADELLNLAQVVYEQWDTLTASKAGFSVADERVDSMGQVTALAVSLSLAPYLQRASDAILPQLDLTLWKKGTCPICSGRPNFSILDEDTGARELMCSRCDTLWRAARLNCPFCAAGEKTTYLSSKDDLYRLYVCPECKRYLKAVDLRKARRVILPTVERLLTIGMDLTAMEEGYQG